ncbi:MAG: hypothetical protein IPH93_10125 [Saprospiraceae bacterium]|nr:hypothetical protein [Saprospiraceae bacterium]MBK7812405.1 hypothetical protein [Saprospiraceae bacterium]MBK9632370.1 hypothetical protein [Saprospiraceae bacterium]
MHKRILFLFYLLYWIGANAQNANPSAILYEKGQADFRVFTNIYYEYNKQQKYCFNTTFLDFMAAVSGKFNAGLRIRYRNVVRLDDFQFTDAFRFEKQKLDSLANYKRHGLSGAEVLFRHKLGTNSAWIMQHSIGIPMGNQLEQHFDRGFLDWDGIILYSQIFHNRNLGRFNYFLDFGIRIENIQSASFSTSKPHYTSFSVPISFLPGFFLTKQNYFYLLSQINPVLAHSVYESNAKSVSEIQNDLHIQLGIGYKLFCFSNWELEFISSWYKNQDKNAITLNLGVRRYFNRILYY